MNNQKRIRIFLVGLAIGAGLGLIMTLGGCSTVSGFAKDLGDASEGLRNAMTQE